jgi:hypothetical protein
MLVPVQVLLLLVSGPKVTVYVKTCMLGPLTVMV